MNWSRWKNAKLKLKFNKIDYIIISNQYQIMSLEHQDWEPKILRKRRPAPKKAKGPAFIKKKDPDEVKPLPKVSLTVGKQIQQARMQKGLTQKQLATQCNVKQQVIQEYECGRGKPDQKVLAKIRRILGMNKKKPKKAKK